MGKAGESHSENSESQLFSYLSILADLSGRGSRSSVLREFTLLECLI